MPAAGAKGDRSTRPTLSCGPCGACGRVRAWGQRGLGWPSGWGFHRVDAVERVPPWCGRSGTRIAIERIGGRGSTRAVFGRHGRLGSTSARWGCRGRRPSMARTRRTASLYSWVERGGGNRFQGQLQQNQTLQPFTPPRSLHSFGLLDSPNLSFWCSILFNPRLGIIAQVLACQLAQVLNDIPFGAGSDTLHYFVRVSLRCSSGWLRLAIATVNIPQSSDDGCDVLMRQSGLAVSNQKPHPEGGAPGFGLIPDVGDD